MNGRVYDPNLGRFLSVDPVFQFPTNTQSLNPYSYVLNNPLSMTDPTGYMATCGGDTKDGQQCDLDKVKSSDVESIQKTKNGQYVVNTKDGGSYTVDSASKTVSTGQGGSVTLSSTFNGNGYTNTLSVNSAQNKPTDTASINSPASVSKNQNSRQNTQSGITDIGSQQGAGSETDKGTVINANIKNADPHSIDTMLSISRGMAYRALVAYAKAHPEATAGWSPQDFLKLKMHAVSGIREGEHLCERCVLTVAYYSRETNSVTIFAGAVLATERNNASFADDLLHEFRHSTPWNIISYQRGYSSYGNLPWAERPWEEDAIQFQRSLEPYIHY